MAREEGGAIHSDTEHLEEKALKEKENVEHKTKQKVALLVTNLSLIRRALLYIPN